MTSDDGMRASDLDRERATEALRSAFAVGRLDLSEFHQRTGAACTARTWSDLRELTADLPEARVPGKSGLDAEIRDGGGCHYNAGCRCNAGGRYNAVGNGQATRRPFLPMVVMALIWLSIAAVGHVAAAIPLVLLSVFLLGAASRKAGPPPQPDGRARPTEARCPGRPAAPGVPAPGPSPSCSARSHAGRRPARRQPPRRRPPPRRHRRRACRAAVRSLE